MTFGCLHHRRRRRAKAGMSARYPRHSARPSNTQNAVDACASCRYVGGSKARQKYQQLFATDDDRDAWRLIAVFFWPHASPRLVNSRAVYAPAASSACRRGLAEAGPRALMLLSSLAFSVITVIASLTT